jgi:hypothetical protein
MSIRILKAAVAAGAVALVSITGFTATYTCSHVSVVDNTVRPTCPACVGYSYLYSISVCVGYGSQETKDCQQITRSNLLNKTTLTCTSGVCTAPAVSETNTPCTTSDASDYAHIGPPPC